MAGPTDKTMNPTADSAVTTFITKSMPGCMITSRKMVSLCQYTAHHVVKLGHGQQADFTVHEGTNKFMQFYHGQVSVCFTMWLLLESGEVEQSVYHARSSGVKARCVCVTISMHTHQIIMLLASCTMPETAWCTRPSTLLEWLAAIVSSEWL